MYLTSAKQTFEQTGKEKLTKLFSSLFSFLYLLLAVFVFDNFWKVAGRFWGRFWEIVAGCFAGCWTFGGSGGFWKHRKNLITYLQRRFQSYKIASFLKGSCSFFSVEVLPPPPHLFPTLSNPSLLKTTFSVCLNKFSKTVFSNLF